jgi:hypothetical protein
MTSDSDIVRLEGLARQMRAALELNAGRASANFARTPRTATPAAPARHDPRPQRTRRREHAVVAVTAVN